jgi:hypothetical protein
MPGKAKPSPTPSASATATRSPDPTPASPSASTITPTVDHTFGSNPGTPAPLRDSAHRPPLTCGGLGSSRTVEPSTSLTLRRGRASRRAGNGEQSISRTAAGSTSHLRGVDLGTNGGQLAGDVGARSVRPRHFGECGRRSLSLLPRPALRQRRHTLVVRVPSVRDPSRRPVALPRTAPETGWGSMCLGCVVTRIRRALGHRGGAVQHVVIAL